MRDSDENKPAPPSRTARALRRTGPGAHVQGHDTELRRSMARPTQWSRAAGPNLASSATIAWPSFSTSASRLSPPSSALLQLAGYSCPSTRCCGRTGRLHPGRLHVTRACHLAERLSLLRTSSTLPVARTRRGRWRRQHGHSAGNARFRHTSGRTVRLRRDFSAAAQRRSRYGSDPLHVWEHRQAEGRGAQSSQPDCRRTRA